VCGSAKKKKRKEGLVMKKILFALVVLLVAAPAWARVDILCEQVGDTDEVIVSFNASTEDPNLVRAIAIDIQCTGDGKILDAKCMNADFYVSPGKARGNVDTVTGTIDYDDPNTACVCPEPGPPPGTHLDTLPGLVEDSNGITIEMATLYESAAPSMEGELVRLYLDGSSFDIVITENQVRGGVVMEDAEDIVEVNAPGCHVEIGCYPSAKEPDYTQWKEVNEPACWCYPRQCHGDVDDANQGDPKSGYFYVWSTELNALLAGWKQVYSGHPEVDGPDADALPDTWICADFDHAMQGDPKSGYFRVWSGDLNVLLANWKSNPDPNCLDVVP
jgi:hypothetical protein